MIRCLSPSMIFFLCGCAVNAWKSQMAGNSGSPKQPAPFLESSIRKYPPPSFKLQAVFNGLHPLSWFPPLFPMRNLLLDNPKSIWGQLSWPPKSSPLHISPVSLFPAWHDFVSRWSLPLDLSHFFVYIPSKVWGPQSNTRHQVCYPVSKLVLHPPALFTYDGWLFSALATTFIPVLLESLHCSLVWKLPGSFSVNRLMMGLSKAIRAVAPWPITGVPTLWPTQHRWPLVQGTSH